MITALKEKVLLIYKSSVNSAKDCALLAKEVQAHTGRNMSETTVRRFFGLLKSKSHLSQYNLDTLAIYCSYQDYDQFSSQLPNNKDPSSIEKVFEKITHFTLNSISKKSLTPFEQTIPRIAVNNALNTFLTSEQPVFIIEAPGGYGKSTTLAHWVKSYIDKGESILFVQAAVLINYLHDANGSNDFSFDLGSQTNVFTKWKAHKAASPLIIIIDAWEEVGYLGKKQEQLLTYINQVVQLFSANISLKIILSFRTSSWEQISRNKPKGRKFAIQGLPGHSLPPFSNDEIRMVIDIANNKTEQAIIYERILWDTLELLKVPFNLYLYTKLHALYDANETIGYNRLLEFYFKEKIFEAKYAEEKEDILWALIAFISSTNTISMPKKMLKQAYPVHIRRGTNYFNAYAELLAESILEEERIVNKYGLYSTVVQFKHHNYLFYLTALDMIRQNNGLSAQMFKNIVWSDHFWTWKTNIIAILFELAYNNEDFDAIKQFCELPNKVHDSLQVRYTVGKAFRNNNRIRNKVIQQFARSENGQTYYFEQFVDTNYLFNNYVYRIQEYLKNKSTNEAILFGNSILFLAGFLKLNKQECIRYKQIVDAIEVDSTFHPWLTGRKAATALMYHGFIEK